MKQFSWMVLLAALFCWGCQEKELASADLPEDTSYEGPLWMIKGVGGGPLTRAVGEKDKFWSAGDTVRIKFLNGSADWQGKVKQYAALWLEHANLRFEYVAATEPADVKIGFDTDEKYVSWSVIGTDCRLVPQDEVSLNFYGFSYETEAGIKAEVLRGIGHVLGLGFEHKNPGCPMEFADELDVADEYGLTEAEVRQLIDTYNTEQINGTEYDPASIMVISVPRILLTRPTRPYATTRNMELSALDKSFIGEVYPAGDSAIIVMKTAKSSLSFFISHQKELLVDWGDGTQELYPIIPPAPEVGEFKPFRHVYADKAEHVIKFYGSNTAITWVEFFDNQLSYLDVQKNLALKVLMVNNNDLTVLDVSNNIALEQIHCDNNLLTSLDISKNVNLEICLCSYCNLSDLDVSKNVNLKSLWCNGNKIHSLDLTNNIQLTTIACWGNGLQNLVLGTFEFLGLLFCADNALTSLDVTPYHDLGQLSCSNNPIGSLDLTNNPSLFQLECENCALTSLNISNNPNLSRIRCSYNPFVLNSEVLLSFVQSLPSYNDPVGYLYIDDSVTGQIKSICKGKGWVVNDMYE